MIKTKVSVKIGYDIAHNLKDHLQGEIPSWGHVLIHLKPNE